MPDQAVAVRLPATDQLKQVASVVRADDKELRRFGIVVDDPLESIHVICVGDPLPRKAVLQG
jgi:hypothetical protein